MQNKPILSICIPTYNREKYLKECLDSVINQEWFDEEKIEIIISDNASKDNTTELVKEYQNKHKNIRYFRNDKNLGSAKNILNLALHLAKWEYVWLFWDDDLMSPVWIRKTTDAIKNHSIDVLLSYRVDFIDWTKPINWINNENGPKILHWLYKFSKFISTDINEYFGRYAELFTFISIMCFKKSIFQDNFNNMNLKYSKKYMDYIYSKHYFWHSVILYWLLRQDSIIWIYKDTLAFTRMENQEWNMWFRILKDLSDVFIKFYINHTKLNKRVLITFFKIITAWIFPAFVWNIKPYINKRFFESMKNIYLKFTKK